MHLANLPNGLQEQQGGPSVSVVAGSIVGQNSVKATNEFLDGGAAQGGYSAAMHGLP